MTNKLDPRIRILSGDEMQHIADRLLAMLLVDNKRNAGDIIQLMLIMFVDASFPTRELRRAVARELAQTILANFDDAAYQEPDLDLEPNNANH